MTASPRSSAPQTFEQTWHETDTAVLNPDTLPVPKAPRAWDRRVQRARPHNGKQKQVWRTYGLRSQPALNEQHEEPLDAHSRVIKKLRVRLDGMGPATSTTQGRKRASKSTQWDRRKSVLPRKRAATHEVKHDTTNEEDHDNTDAESEEKEEKDKDNAADQGLNNQDGALEAQETCSTHSRRVSEFTFRSEDVPDDLSSETIHRDTCASDSPTHLEIGSEMLLYAEEDKEPQNTSPTTVRHSSDKDVPLLLETPAPSPPTSSIVASTVLIPEQCASVDEGIEDEDAVDEDLARSYLEQEAESEVANEPANSGSSISSEQIIGTEESVIEDNVQEQSNEKSSFTDVAAADAIPGAEPCEFDLEFHDISPDKQDDLCEDQECLKEDLEGENNTVVVQSPPLEIQMVDFSEELQAPEEHLSGISPQTDEIPQSPRPGEDPVTQEEDDTDSVEEEMFEDLNTANEEAEEQDSVTSNYITEDAGHTAGFELALSPSSIREDAGQNILDTQKTGSLESRRDDIAAGLTLEFRIASSTTSKERQSRSPTPPAEDLMPHDSATTIHLDDDTALLKDFISRAAQSRTNKAAIITRRESLQNRRDSDAVRQALASPRKVLEDKDPNSPSKHDTDGTMDLSQTLRLAMNQQPALSASMEQMTNEDVEMSALTTTSRRSTRTRISRLPALSSAQQRMQGPTSISVRRTDGTEPVVIKKTEAQELAMLTRLAEVNAKKNKQGAVSVRFRLLKLKVELENAPPEQDSTDSDSAAVKGKKSLRWDPVLVYYQGEPVNRDLGAAEGGSPETSDDLNLPVATPSTKVKTKIPKDKTTTPKMRRVRGLGATNGTPGKGLLVPTPLLPDELRDDQEHSVVHSLLKSSRINKLPIASSAAASDSQLPTLQPLPTGTDIPSEAKAMPVKDRKSKLATPRKVKLPQPVTLAPSVVLEGKENQQARGLSSPAKKGLALPQVVVPSVVESGLPRRRPQRRV